MAEDEVASLRAQAKNCREIAAGSVAPDARLTLLGIANDYDTRADKLEERKARN
jgi:hypothetical protein